MVGQGAYGKEGKVKIKKRSEGLKIGVTMFGINVKNSPMIYKKVTCGLEVRKF